MGGPILSIGEIGALGEVSDIGGLLGLYLKIWYGKSLVADIVVEGIRTFY